MVEKRVREMTSKGKRMKLLNELKKHLNEESYYGEVQEPLDAFENLLSKLEDAHMELASHPDVQDKIQRLLDKAYILVERAKDQFDLAVRLTGDEYKK